jgi:hypothetical protein
MDRQKMLCHCEERSDEAIQELWALPWIASALRASQ